jgi:16S rRNA (guanine527-N7)-methyltransferase
LRIELSEHQIERLQLHCDLIEKWNKAFNLVSRKDISRLAARHVLDSLCGVSLLRGMRVLDLGSGAGLPGIPLAVAAESIHFTLCDRSARRVRFLRQTIAALELSNVELWQGDFPGQVPGEVRFDTIVARAVATASAVWDMVRGHLQADGRVLVYESTKMSVGADSGGHEHGFRAARSSFNIPGLEEAHSIVCLERS